MATTIIGASGVVLDSYMLFLLKRGPLKGNCVEKWSQILHFSSTVNWRERWAKCFCQFFVLDL